MRAKHTVWWLLAVALAVLVAWWRPGHAASGAPAVGVNVGLNLYDTKKPLPETAVIDLPLNGFKAGPGLAEVRVAGWDLDEAGEGTFAVGACQPVPLVAERKAANDSKDGEVWLDYPSACFVAQPGFSTVPVYFTHTLTLGFKITRVEAWLSSAPVFAPRITAIGKLQNDGVIPRSLNPSEVVPKAFTTGGVVYTALCVTGTRDEHYPVTTTPGALFLWARTSNPLPVTLYPQRCADAWETCWPGETPKCQ